MTNTDKNWKVPEKSANTADKTKKRPYRDFSSYRSYNDIPCREGEKMVPFFTTYKDAVERGFNMENLETWNIRGHKILVGFTPAEESLFDEMIRVFNQDVHEAIINYKHYSKNLSLDKMQDDILDEDGSDQDLTGTTEMEEVARVEMGVGMLIEYYYSAGESRKARCIQMLAAGYTKEEIHMFLLSEVKKSRAYEFIKKTQEEGYRLYRERFDLNRI